MPSRRQSTSAREIREWAHATKAKGRQRWRPSETNFRSAALLLLPEHLGNLIMERPHEVRHHSARVRLNEHLYWHPGDQFDLTKPRDLVRRNCDAHRVITCAGSLILGDVSRHHTHFAIELRRRAAVEVRKAHHGR